LIKSIARYIIERFKDRKEHAKRLRQAYQSIPKEIWDLIISDLMVYAEFNKPCWDSKFTPFIEGKRGTVLKLLANFEMTEQDFLNKLGETNNERPDTRS
jgi:hypothetical protein